MLSKSRYLSGRQCAKRLWIEANARELLPAVDPARRAVFDQGHEVGALAQRLFPGGREIDRSQFDWPGVIAATAQALAERRPLYEAAFSHQGAACRVDILVPVEGGAWDLFEVKSSTQPKDEHIDDVALQVWVLRGAGVAVRRGSLIHLNSGYLRGAELELDRLFTVLDLSPEIEPMMPELAGRVGELIEVQERENAPEVAIGRYCNEPYPCPLIPRCWSGVPEESVFTLHRGRPTSWQLFRAGVLELTGIPADLRLSAAQRIQVAAARDRTPHIDHLALRRFLGRLAEPLIYFDLESFALAVPRFPGTRPYQQVPFQFSLHRVESAGGRPRSTAFLAEGSEDPRPAFLDALRAELDQSTAGAIVAFNAGFEKARLVECATAFPEHATWINEALTRFVDLWEPFRNFSYYHPDQLGRSSLKTLLPILGERGYDHLDIRDGGEAAREFLRSLDPALGAGERARIRAALLDYCDRDTAGMIEIVESLRDLGGGQ